MTTRERTAARKERSNDISDYLDEDEQKEMIKRLQDQNAQANKTYRNLFGLAGIVLGIGKLYYMMSHLNFPFELMPHAQFSEEFPFWAIWLMEGLSALGFALSAVSIGGWMTRVKSRTPLICSLVAGVTLTLAWLVQVGLREPLAFTWFAGANLGFALVCWLVVHLIEDSEVQVQGMHKMMYNFKKP